jgi:asparagine synthase (glutamine-hydrolysing)
VCGITGWIGHGNELREPGERALAMLRYRGPDGSRLWIDDAARVALANARLAILDLRHEADQPMDRDGLRITYNGEIYNFIELRTELEAGGAHFSTGSDTEVILASYRRWGDAMFARLNGMWALALWDPARRALILSRDRFGEKPLFLAAGQRCVHFASEIKTLLSFSCLRWEPDLDALRDFVSLGEVLDGTSRSFFRGIDRVAPATYVIYDVALLNATTQPYWQLIADESARRLSLDDARDGLAHLLADSVRLRLRSDVPVGLSLSGGLDSSSLALQLEALGRRDVRAFTLRWTDTGDDRSDESAIVPELLRRAGLEGDAIVAAPGDLERAAEKVLWHQDEPFAHTAPFGEWCVYQRAAARGVHVLMEGQGADELLGGYHALAFGARWAGLMQGGSVYELWSELAAFRRVQRQPLTRAAVYLAMALSPAALRRRLRRIRWGSSSLGASAARAEQDAITEGDDALRRALRRALLVSSLPALLRYADRASMAHSVEVRLPFLDHRLVAFAFGIQSRHLVAEGQTKRVLREVVRGPMPALAERAGKFGFTAPESAWIAGPLRPWAAALIAKTEHRGIYPAGSASHAWQRVVAGRAPAQLALRLVVAELWLQRYADESGRPPS